MDYSVCASAVFSGTPLPEALPRIRRAGAQVYEIWEWWNQDIDAWEAAHRQSGLRLCAICTRMIPLTDPARRGEYLDGLRESIGVAKRLGCSMLISQVGQELDGVPRAEQHASIVGGLRACVPFLEEAGMTLVIEPLNTRMDHPGYYLSESEEALAIIRETGSPHVKVLYDVYHQQITEGHLTDTLRKHIADIGHIHIASVPGRHEPDSSCEVHFPAVFAALKEAGYTGAVGMEFFPTKDPEQCVRELIEAMPL